MDHQQWLEWRRNGIGSSDAPIIMGVSPWKTKYQLWQEKVFGLSDQKENPSMARGRELEEVARREFERIMGIGVFPKNVEHKDFPWIRASLDGIDLDGEVMVEIKCPGREDHFGASNKKVPEKYYPQCQHQLLATGLDHMFYFSFDGMEGAVVEVKRDEVYIEKLLQEESKFWDMRTNRIPPEICDRDFVDMNSVKKWKEAATNWSKWKKILEDAEEKESFYRKILIASSEGKNATGHGIKLSKSMCEGRIDTKKAMEDHPEILWDLYRKESFERISIKEI
jgi:putative phage-type endonuclease